VGGVQLVLRVLSSTNVCRTAVSDLQKAGLDVLFGIIPSSAIWGVGIHELSKWITGGIGLSP
jgi:hypothetical protein